VRQPERDARQGRSAHVSAAAGGRIDVRELTADELELVDAHLPLSRLESAQTYLVAWDRGAPVGHAHVAWTGTKLGVPEVQDVFVLETHRRRGLGSALMLAAERLAAKRGCTRISLSYGVGNAPARSFYKALGYRAAGIERERAQGTIVIRGTPVEIDETMIYLVKDIVSATP
jgi:GNAT superfamily N-acetyltransferase